MRIVRHSAETPPSLRGGVVAIGNFDGVHRGHQAVISRAATLAAGFGAPRAVLTFEPHPRRFFRPEIPPFLLTPFRAKAQLLAALGVEMLAVQRFDAAFAHLDADAFIRRILVDGLAARHVVVGYDFTFGHERSGNVDVLKRAGSQYGFGVTAVGPVASADGEIFSSTNIRDYLVGGKPGHAAALLGRPFEIHGMVLGGDRRGRTIGFPTANLTLGGYIRPAFGVYAVRAGVETEGRIAWHDGVANLGLRPTVDGSRLLLETHLFDFARDIYNTHLRVALIEFIRPEQKFSGLDALKAQIAEDCVAARSILTTRAAGAI